MGSAFRVLQGADFLLHQPLEPAGVLPADLREIFNQARERSALKVFHQAISSSADLLLLTGTLARIEEEPRLGCFLLEQFRRLVAERVRIVWAASSEEKIPDWATESTVSVLRPGTELTLPSLRSKGTMTVAWPATGHKVSMSDHDHLVVTIQRFAQGSGVEYSIHGEPAATRHRTIPIQESGPQDQTPCGMWLTEIGTSHRATPSLLPTSTVHWAHETVEVQPDTTRADLLREMEHRLTELNRHRNVELVLVDWTLEGTGPLLSSLLHDVEIRDLLQASRSLPGTQQRLWNWKIETRPSEAQLEHWQRESDVYAQALNIQKELASSSPNGSAEIRDLPGHDHAHPPHQGRIHWVKKRLAHSLLRHRPNRNRQG